MAQKKTHNTKFKKGNKAAEKWTEEKAIELGVELINWLTEKDEDGEDKGNMLFKEFLVIERGLYNEIVSYLANKYESFLKLYTRAQEIQEVKLQKYGLADRLNAVIVKFSLINNHGWKDKKEIGADVNLNTNMNTFEEIRKNAGITDE